MKPHDLLGLLIALILLLPGCQWDGRRDASLNRRVSERVHDIARSSLRERSQSAPRTVEQQLDTVMTRHPTLSSTDAADTTVALSIDDLRQHVLINNVLIDVTLFDPAIAQARLGEEQAKFDPLIIGGLEYTKKNPPELDGDLVRFSATDKSLDKREVKLTEVEQSKESLAADLGIEFPLATGGSFKLLSFMDENDTLSPQRFEQFVSGMKFSISQPLLRGAGIAANTASIQLARLDAQSSMAEAKLNAMRVLVEAETMYWSLYEARKTLEVRHTQYDTAYDNLELVQQRVRQGLSPRIEIVRAEVGVTSRLEHLIVAETRFRVVQRALKQLLNRDDLPMESATVIVTTATPQLVRFDLDARQLVQEALANRIELLELELQLAADGLRIDLARNQVLPDLRVGVSYGMLERQRSPGGSWRGAWDFDNTEFAVGLRAEVPLTNQARKSRLRRMLLKQSRRMANQELREMLIRQEVLDALDILEQDWRRMLAARQNVIVSGVNYEAELKQFNEGLRTMREVLEALAILGDAQLHEIRAMVSYQISQISLALATGTLLAYAPADGQAMPLNYRHTDH